MHTVGAMVVGKLLGGTRQWDPAIGYWIVKLLALILPHKQLRSFDTGPLRVDIPARCCCPLRGSLMVAGGTAINYTNLDDGRGWCAAAAAADCASTPSIESINEGESEEGKGQSNALIHAFSAELLSYFDGPKTT